jgi:hypothetical protein
LTTSAPIAAHTGVPERQFGVTLATGVALELHAGQWLDAQPPVPQLRQPISRDPRPTETHAPWPAGVEVASSLRERMPCGGSPCRTSGYECKDGLMRNWAMRQPAVTSHMQ